MVALRLLQTESVNVHKRRVMSRFKSVMEEVDMALYDRSSGIGFVYGNLGDLLKKVSARGMVVNHRNSPFRQAALEQDPHFRKDTLVQLKENMGKLDDLHKRLNFMLMELEGLVKKS
jgi:hypothetical protein